MRRKQLFALVMAGALTMGSVPYAAFAEDGTVAAEQSLEEGQAAEETQESSQEPAGEEPQNSEEIAAQEPTQETVPEELPPEPAQETVTEAPAQELTQEPAAVQEPELNPAQEAADALPTEAPTEAPTATPTDMPEAEAPGDTVVKTTADLQAAIESADKETTVIMVDVPDGADAFTVSAEITVPEGKDIVIIPASGKTVTMKRDISDSALEGSLFKVADGASLTISSGEDEAASITGYSFGKIIVDGSCSNTPVPDKSTGALISGGASSTVVLSGIDLMNNISDTNLGGAVDLPSGTLNMKGCTVSNCGSVFTDGAGVSNGGAVYAAGTVGIDGTVTFQNLTGRGIVLYKTSDPDDLDGMIIIAGENAVSCKIPFSVIGAAENMKVIELNGRSDMVNDGNLVFEPMDGQNLVLNADGILVTPTPTGEPTPTPTEGPSPSPTGEPTPVPSTEPTSAPTPTATPTPTVEPLDIKKAGTTLWVSHSMANITFTVNKDAKYYYEVYECADPKGSHSYMFDVNKAKTNVKGNEATTLDIEGFGEETASGYFDIVLFAIDNDRQTDVAVFHIKNSTRPADVTDVTPTPTYAPRIPAVTESTVSGLEKPLAFYPNTFYDFTVTGAGTDNTNPGKGDVKWVPIYWSTSSNPTESQRNDKWRIGAKNGITQAATYNMYVFFQKWEYDGSQWKATDTVESVVYQFRSQAITLTPTGTVTPSVDPASGDAGSGSGSDGGSGTAGEDDPESNTGSTASTGATTTASAANTADEAPVGNMFLLLSASLLVGGYVIVRRRMKAVKNK